MDLRYETPAVLATNCHPASAYRLVIVILLSGHLLLLHAASSTTAKKYYPAYRKPEQLLQTQPQPQPGFGYHQQPFQSPMVTLHGSQANQVQRMSSYYAKKRAQGQSHSKLPVAAPSYPNVHTYNTYKKANKIPARA